MIRTLRKTEKYFSNWQNNSVIFFSFFKKKKNVEDKCCPAAYVVKI